MIHLHKNSLKLCRLCGKDKPRGTDVFKDKIKGAVLVSIINKYFPTEVINVSTNDIFSKYVCMDCEQKICNFDEFCLMVANVQKQLAAPSLEIDFAEDMLCHLKENELSIDKNKYYTTNDKNKKHQCEQCGKTFRCHAHLERHKRIHTGQRPFVCNICPMSFNQPEILAKHHESHQGKKLYCCNICHQSFRFKVSLKSHMLNLHPTNDTTTTTTTNNINEKSINCIDCGKIFATKYKLQRHMRCHTGERPYNCNYCNRTFSQTGNLKLHQLKCSSTIIQIQNIQQQQINTDNNKSLCQNNDNNTLLNDQTIQHYPQIYITDSEIQKTINETINSSVTDTSSYLKNYDNQIYNIDDDIETILDCDLGHLDTTNKYTNVNDKLSLCDKQPETPELIHSLLYDE